MKQRALAVRLAGSVRAPAEARNALVSLSVQRSTLQQYEAHLKLFREFMIASGKLQDGMSVAEVATQDDLLQFLDAVVRDPGTEAKVGPGLRSALRKQLQLLGLPLWIDSEVVSAAFKGARYRGGEAKRTPRGTVTEEMLQELLQHTRQVAPEMVDAILVQFRLGLRISQLVGLQAGDVSRLPPRIWLRIDKRENASNTADKAVGPHWRDVEDEEVLNILCRLQAVTPRGSLLFPRSKWNLEGYRRHIAKAAITLGWPVELKYDGSHVLRHGGIGAARRRMESQGIPEREIAKRLDISLPMLRHYAEPLEKRLRKEK